MVRLMAKWSAALSKFIPFQFLYGAINGAVKMPDSRKEILFQFLYGAINGKNRITTFTSPFNFNSSMVRLMDL